jgi:L-amino acid N-acyltransferase YncA
MIITHISRDDFKLLIPKFSKWCDKLKKHGQALINNFKENRHILIAKENYKILGFLIYHVSERRNKKIITVELTCVKHKHRSKGIGKKLLASLAGRNNEDIVEIVSEVSKGNVASRAKNLSLGAQEHEGHFIMNPKTVLLKDKMNDCKKAGKIHVKRKTKFNPHGYCRKAVAGTTKSVNELRKIAQKLPNNRGYSRMNKVNLVKLIKQNGILI